MEQLTKQQLVLVGVLVSFVTSIATGIVTVSLMEQAPEPVVQTINRVVERTIETVVQAPAAASQQAAVVTKETIVLKSDDLVMEAVEKNTPHVARIERVDETGKRQTLALGLIISEDGLILTSAAALGLKATSTKALPFEVKVQHATTTISVIAIDKGSEVAVVKAALGGGEKWSAATLGNSDGVKLGQAVVILSGRTALAVKSGIIASLPRKETTDDTASSTPKTKSTLASIETDLGGSDILGSVVLNLSGEVIGLALTESGYSFTPINLLKSVLE